jgi:hypothetical protein
MTTTFLNLDQPIDLKIQLYNLVSNTEFEILLYRERNRYEEYENGALIRTIKCPKDHMPLLLMEMKIAELLTQRYELTPPDTQWTVAPFKSSTEHAQAFVAYLYQISNPLAELIDAQVNSIVNRHIGMSSIETQALTQLGDNFDFGCKIDISDSYGIHIHHQDKGFVWLEDLDLVSLYDSELYWCEESGIKELQVDPNESYRLNCAHLGALRRFLYTHPTQTLRYLCLDIDLRSLLPILDLLALCGLQNLPLALNLGNGSQLDVNALMSRLTPRRAKIISYNGDVNWLRFFTEDSVQSLYSLKPLAEFEEYLEFLQKIPLKNLIHLDVPFHFDAEMSQQFWCLPIVKQLHTVVLGRYPYADDEYAFDEFIQLHEQWQHLEKIYINGHLLSDEVINRFVDYPQVIFTTYDSREQLGTDLVAFGYCATMY